MQGPEALGHFDTPRRSSKGTSLARPGRQSSSIAAVAKTSAVEASCIVIVVRDSGVDSVVAHPSTYLIKFVMCPDLPTRPLAVFI